MERLSGHGWHFSSINSLRIIRKICDGLESSDVDVFEIGAGSGYLGAFLIKLGYRYTSMDNTQNFYLWQNRLYNMLCKQSGELNEWAHINKIVRENGRVNHIPWWNIVGSEKHH